MTVSKTVGTIAVWVQSPPCAPEYKRGYTMAKKEICITVDKKMVDNIHNAVVAYLEILDRCFLGLELPGKFEKFAELSDEEIDERRQSIVNVLRQIETKAGMRKWHTPEIRGSTHMRIGRWKNGRFARL